MHKFYINLTLELNPKHYNFLIYLLFIYYNYFCLSNKCSILCIFDIYLYKSGLIKFAIFMHKELVAFIRYPKGWYIFSHSLL